MNFIKKIFDGRIDESVHLQFQKFSKGRFSQRAIIVAKKSRDSYRISTGPEFANELVRQLAEELGNSKTSVTGVIVSTLNLNEEPKFRDILGHCDVKQFMGVKQFKVNKELSGNEILELAENFQKAFFALSFGTKDSELKIKPKAPKSAKPSTKSDEKIKADFCKIATKNKSFGEEFVFEKKDFKSAEISHDFMIENIILPKSEKDFAKIREMAQRQGRILRNAVIDGKEMKSEKEFTA